MEWCIAWKCWIVIRKALRFNMYKDNLKIFEWRFKKKGGLEILLLYIKLYIIPSRICTYHVQPVRWMNNYGWFFVDFCCCLSILVAFTVLFSLCCVIFLFSVFLILLFTTTFLSYFLFIFSHFEKSRANIFRGKNVIRREIWTKITNIILRLPLLSTFMGQVADSGTSVIWS